MRVSCETYTRCLAMRASTDTHQTRTAARATHPDMRSVRIRREVSHGSRRALHSSGRRQARNPPSRAGVVHRRGMTMVTWDDSAGDWATRDAGVVARRILRKVRPGSIIDLHDGLDGNVTADRSVLVRALPMILDGLAQRHLHAVRLDELLGRRGYVRC